MLTVERVKELYYHEDGKLYGKVVARGRTSLGKRAGYEHPSGYRHIKIDGKNYSEHRVIWMLVYGEPPSMKLDHIDRNKSNNRIENLRLATNAENGANVIYPDHKNKTGYVGVSFQKNKFRARIIYNNEMIHLGYYSTAQQASRAYQQKALELRREFHPQKD